MSKIIYIVASLALIGTFAAIIGTVTVSQRNLSQATQMADLWEAWKLEFGKQYATTEEESHKFATF